MTAATNVDDLEVVPANRATWEQLQTVFGERGEAAGCQCQWPQTPASDWRGLLREERAERLRAETRCGHPRATTTTGIVAFLGEEPVGWCAVQPRSAFLHLRTGRTVFAGRDEDPDDDSVWAAVCFVTRSGYRRRGVSRALAAAAVDFARDRGARALEGYPMVTREGLEYSWGELFVGSTSVFAAAGLREVAAPSTRRRVMRIDFETD